MHLYESKGAGEQVRESACMCVWRDGTSEAGEWDLLCVLAVVMAYNNQVL